MTGSCEADFFLWRVYTAEAERKRFNDLVALAQGCTLGIIKHKLFPTYPITESVKDHIGDRRRTEIMEEVPYMLVFTMCKSALRIWSIAAKQHGAEAAWRTLDDTHFDAHEYVVDVSTHSTLAR